MRLTNWSELRWRLLEAGLAVLGAAWFLALLALVFGACRVSR